MSKYEAMRIDPKKWKLGAIYYCPEDPRIIVRQRLPVGWAWNFGHSKVYLAILVAVFAFLMPQFVAWYLGIRSAPALGLVAIITLIVIVFVADRMSREPEI